MSCDIHLGRAHGVGVESGQASSRQADVAFVFGDVRRGFRVIFQASGLDHYLVLCANFWGSEVLVFCRRRCC